MTPRQATTNSNASRRSGRTVLFSVLLGFALLMAIAVRNCESQVTAV
jgi:hypothetical protein